MDDILLKIYQEANEHLRSSDNKRDQIIAFYLVILGFLFGSFDKINKELSIQAALAIILIIGVFGLLLGFLLVEFRFWHTIYVNTAVVIQNLALSKMEPTEENIKAIWETYQKQLSMEKFWALSTEKLTFRAFLLIAPTPFYLFYTVYLQKYDFWIIVLCHVVYIYVVDKISTGYLRKQLSRGYKASWLLRVYLIQKSDKEQNLVDITIY